MFVSWSEFLFLTFAAFLNSLSNLRLECELGSEFREAANGTHVESVVNASCIRIWR